MIAARRCEIQDLQHTLQACEVVGAVADLVHALQKERGLSNGFLASNGLLFASVLPGQTQDCIACEARLQRCFDQLLDVGDTALLHGARLYSQIAFALQRLGMLRALRHQVQTFQIAADLATSYFSSAIGGLLAVVFEAADTRSLGAGHPDIAKLLLALFNFSQGKEYAGQERACGAAFFAVRLTSNQSGSLILHWANLIAQQESCLALFGEFATPGQKQHWMDALAASQKGRQATDMHLKHLRMQAHQAAASACAMQPDWGAVWFDCCTFRIDAMKQTENVLTADLLALCRLKLQAVTAELEQQQTLLPSLQMPQMANPSPLTPTPYGPQLEGFVLKMLAQQSQRLEAVQQELAGVQAALGERKVVERAKGLLMEKRQLSEAEAYGWIRQTAMNQGRRMGDVAQNLLAQMHSNPAA